MPSFEELLTPHQAHLHRLAFRLTGSEADGYDLVQDVLLKLYQRRAKLGAIEHLRPWLTKVLLRAYLDSCRKKKRSLVRLFNRKQGREGEGASIEDVACPHPPPDQQLEQESRQRQVMAAVKSLNRDQRLVCILHDMEGYSLPELVAVLNSPLGTLKSRLHRARARLKMILSAQEEGTL